MRRRQFLVGAGATAFAASSARAATINLYDLDNGRLGADLTGDDFRGVQEPLHPAALTGTALAVLNAASADSSRVVLKNLPSISTQGVPKHYGSPGSCEAQSFGYCLGAYTAARNPDGSRKWSAAEPANQPSVAWLYQYVLSQAGHTCPGGSKAVPYATKLVATGAPSNQRYPYNSEGKDTPAAVCEEIEQIDVTDPGPDAVRLAVGSYKGYSGLIGQERQHLETFKALIRNGHAIAFSGLVAKRYCIPSPPLSRGAFIAPDGPIEGSGHGQTIVGFDDSKGPRGAFLVQNSFGPQWNRGPADDPGFNGRIWWGYGAWFSTQSFALIMYPNLNRTPSGAKLASFATGAPDLYLCGSKRGTRGTKAWLAIILQATDGVTINRLTVTGQSRPGRLGWIPGATTSQSLGEMLRFGYVYAESNAEFAPGRYTASLSATTQNGTPVTYSGDFDVS